MNYSMRDVERVLQLPRSTLQGLVRLGFVRPARGARRQYLFSFQDLIILRAARALMQANIPRRRIRRSLGQLRERLPEAVPLSGLAICAVGDRVVVREGANHWQADDGQYLLGLDVSVQNGTLRVIEHKQARATAAAQAEAEAAGNRAATPAGAVSADEWFSHALRLESSDPAAAIDAYARAAEADAGDSSAWINWGRLLHERGDARAAEKVYRRALASCGADSLLLFNLGVALEDLGEKDEALAVYHAAISEDPNLADCHYNLARLYESAGKTQHAIRHLGQYRRLMTRNEH
ncbi:MAG: tetratricopeptide repeat protein [Gammaproteobacteria bacterium]|nr:tetratricopeptide repeat protein [Gammaproteobacteria bacterium]MDE2263595.1 tetratricopeptide repeat protein [Gammaproteobacteria bacterium]